MLSSSSKYSILVLQYASHSENGSFIPISEIAKVTDTPGPYLAKISKELSWADFIESRRGAGGGIRITDKGREATLFKVCEAMKDPITKQDCVLRDRACNPNAPCAFHSKFAHMRTELINFLMTSKVSQLSDSDTHKLIQI